MISLDPEAAYRLWAPNYDCDPNPVLALELRTLRDRLGLLQGRTVIDAGCGTGRWTKHVESCGARAFGIDLSAEMLARGEGARVRGDIGQLPFADDSADLAICSMTLGYVSTPSQVIGELLRVAKRAIVSDFHPAATAAGWTRSFRAHGQTYQIRNHAHPLYALQTGSAGIDWSLEARFGESERELFELAGKSAAFEAARAIPVLCAVCFSRERE